MCCRTFIPLIVTCVILTIVTTGTAEGQSCPQITDPHPLNTNADSDTWISDRFPRLATDGHGKWLAVRPSDGDLGGTDPACVDVDGDGKVTICHMPLGNPENAHTISVSVNSVPAHLTHGDNCGPCEDPCDDVACIVVQDNTDVYNPPGTRSCNILLHINEPGVTLLAVGNADITTSDPNGFFQHEFGSDTAPNVLLVDLFPELAHDSYVDIGIEIDGMWGLDGTQLDADWDTCAFNCTEEACPPPPPMCCTQNTLCGQVLGGWFNTEPVNGQGIPDEEGNVFIAQFTVGVMHNVSGNVTVLVKGDFGLPPAPGDPDLDGDGTVTIYDLGLFLLAPWGTYGPCPPFIPEDLDQDCDVDIFDLAILLAAWGPVGGPVPVNVVALPLSFECPGPSSPALQEPVCGDGLIDTADLAMLLGAWGPNPGHPADLDENGDVGAFDLALLLGAWGLCL